jgi:Domain of unknown function (DUF1868)
LDENYQIYLNRILRNTLAESYKAQVQHIQSSPKFARSGDAAGNAWQPTPFPGYTVITPPAPDDGKNTALYSTLTQFQSQVSQRLGPDCFIPIPAASFHLTLADLIWADAYKHAQTGAGFDQKLQAQVAQSFQQCSPFLVGQPIRFQVVGLMVMTRAIAMALAATDEVGYYNILNLRRSLYQNSGLIEIGIEQQYHFTPHITLGYFGDLSNVDRETLSTQLDSLNQSWLGNAPQEFWVHQAELRQFHDMTQYDRQPTWPALTF